MESGVCKEYCKNFYLTLNYFDFMTAVNYKTITYLTLTTIIVCVPTMEEYGMLHCIHCSFVHCVGRNYATSI